MTSQRALNIWPQPASGQLNLDGRSDILAVRLFDLQGRSVYQEALAPAATQLLMLPQLRPAVYLLKVETREGTIYRRVSLQ